MKGAFSIKSKKTPYQRHKELEEEKKRKADEEAAKVYEEFVESFKGDEGPGRDSGVKTFVRGGVVAPGSRSHEATGAWECTNHIDLLCVAPLLLLPLLLPLFPPLLLPLLSSCHIQTFHSYIAAFQHLLAQSLSTTTCHECRCGCSGL